MREQVVEEDKARAFFQAMLDELTPSQKAVLHVMSKDKTIGQGPTDWLTKFPFNFVSISINDFTCQLHQHSALNPTSMNSFYSVAGYSGSVLDLKGLLI